MRSPSQTKTTPSSCSAQRECARSRDYSAIGGRSVHTAQLRLHIPVEEVRYRYIYIQQREREREREARNYQAFAN